MVGWFQLRLFYRVKGPECDPFRMSLQTVMPWCPERCHHFIVGRFPVLRLLLPDLLNGAPLLLRNAATSDLLIPVTSVLPVASWVLLNVLTERGKIKRFDPVDPCFVGVEGRSVEIHGGGFELD